MPYPYVIGEETVAILDSDASNTQELTIEPTITNLYDGKLYGNAVRTTVRVTNPSTTNSYVGRVNCSLRMYHNATDAADYLVNHGVPFRDAHSIVGQLVLYCIDKNISLDDMTLEEYKAISPVFEDDIYDAISIKTCIEKRNTIGAPGRTAMENVIAINQQWLENL